MIIRLIPNGLGAGRAARCRQWFVLGLLLLGTGCGPDDDSDKPPPDAQLLLLTGATMGTHYTIKVLGQGLWDEEPGDEKPGDELKESLGAGLAEGEAEQETTPSRLQSKVDAELQRLTGIFSSFDTTSELSRFNRHPVANPMAVSPELMAVLRISATLYWLSEGAFDVTLGPLINLWGFGHTPRNNHGVPSKEAINTALNQIGFDDISLGRGTATRRREVTLNLSGVAKGYAVDKLAELLDAEGITDYLVEIGGEIKASGKNPRGEDWKVAIEHPHLASVSGVFKTLPVQHLGVATSGNYRNFFEVDAQRYSHTIDPTSGWPIKHNLVSVTVLHEQAAWADALATAFSVLGLEQSLVLAKREGWMFLAIVKQPELTGQDAWLSVASPAMDAYLADFDDPQ